MVSRQKSLFFKSEEKSSSDNNLTSADTSIVKQKIINKERDNKNAEVTPVTKLSTFSPDFFNDAIYLIDVSGFIFRAYYAMPPLTRADKTPVGAVFGFCQMISKLIQTTKSDSMIAICDSGRKTFRNDIFSEYKANRKDTPEDLIPQFSIIDDACEAFGLPTVRKPGYEADDLIASYARYFSKNGHKVVVVSADKDLMQLVGGNIIMYDPMKGKMIDAEGVVEKFGVGPDKVIEVQALMGDSSDNIPGVPGIGPKTAKELILSYGSVEGLYEHVEEIKQKKRKETLIENKELAFISKQLVTLKDDIEITITDPKIGEKIKLDGFLKDQGFENLRRRFGTNTSEVKKEVAAVRTLITTKEQLELWLERVHKYGKLAFDTETTSLHIHQAKLVGISLATYDGDSLHSAYIPLMHTDRTNVQLPLDTVRQILKPYFENAGILKIAHNLKYDLSILKNHGFTCDFSAPTFQDSMLISYCLNAGKHRHSLDELSNKYLGVTPISFKDVMQKGYESFADVELDAAKDYACEDAELTLQLYNLFKPKLAKQKLASLYHEVEQPLVAVIAAMESEGILVNADKLKTLGEKFRARLQDLEQEIYKIAGFEFNPSSAKQLGDILFNNMQLPGAKKTKSGQFVTDAKVLERLASEGHALPQKILEWRSLIKLNSTYVEGLLSAIDKNTKRVHTSYVLSGTATGRLASSDPNLQNIPVRTEDGRHIREAFIAKPGCVLASFDYSQIELRLLAHYSRDANLLEAFIVGQDIHKQTAALIFEMTIENVTSDARQKAKAINFGIIYGISAYGLSQQLQITTGEAKIIIERYLKKYPGIAEYVKRMQESAKEHGYITTLMGRRCYTPGINDHNHIVKNFALRQAANSPLQGSNADMIKVAMAEIANLLLKKETKMLLQVHDELIFEGPEEELRELTPRIRSIMENVIKLDVPVVVDGKFGLNWQDMPDEL